MTTCEKNVRAVSRLRDTVLFLTATLAAAAWAAAPEAVLSSETLTARFDGAGRGRLVSLVDRAGRDYVSPRNTDAPLWVIHACRAGAFTNTTVATANQAKRFRVEVKDMFGRDAPKSMILRLVWEDAGAAVGKAVATILAKPGDPALRCRLEVTPKPGWALVETQFPRFAVNECLGSTPTDDAIVLGTGHGGLVRNPMDPRREYWKNRLWGHSPGNLVAQFGCYFDDRGGLYTAAEDADGNEKELLLDRWWRATRPDGSYTGGAFLCRWSRFEYSEKTDLQPYDILLQGFTGAPGEETTWYDAADIYKKWALKQAWCRKTFLEKTDFLPAWTREAPVVMGFNRSWFDHPDLLKGFLNDFWLKKFPDAPLVSILEGWEHHGDWITTEYFPVYPSEEKFAEFARRIKSAHGHLWPWPGGHHWNILVGKKSDGSYRLDFSKDFYARAAAHAVADPNGRVHLDDLVWLGGGTSASMCPGDPWTVDWWNRDVACALVKRGCDMVQADQDVGAGIPTCWSTKHGHKPGPGKWRLAAQRHQFETMLGEMRRIEPGAIFSFEEMHELFNDIYCFCDYRNLRYTGPEWASVWNYLYHEFVPPFQSGGEQYSRWAWMVAAAVDGQMPRLPVQTTYYGAKDEPLFRNGGFETSCPTGRGALDWENPEEHEIVSGDAAEGSRAIRICGRTRRVQVARNIPFDAFFQPNATYRLSGAVKCEKPGGSIFATAIRREGERYVSYGGASLNVTREMRGWTRFSKEFTLRPGAENFRVMLNAPKGAAYLADDLKLEVRKADGTFAPLARIDSSHGVGMLAFVEGWIRLYRGEGRKFLAHGRALHPPKVDCALTAYEENFRGSIARNTKPSVFASAWEAADGARALCFGNATAYEQKFSYRWQGAWTTLTLAPHALRLVPAAGRPHAAYVPEPKPIKTDLEVTALYYPGTEHQPEWDMVEQTMPHTRPLLGWYDEGHPENVDWQIKWAVEHGISSFCVDWYWHRGEQRLDHWVKAFYRAKYRKYLKWYMMYANHNDPGSHSTEDQIAVTKWWIDHYFKTPEYYTIDGKPVVVYWQYEKLDADFIAEAAAKGETLKKGEGVKRAFAITERLVREAGLPGVCWINMNNRWKHTEEETRLVREMGFSAQMTYNVGGRGPYHMAPGARTPFDTPALSSFDLMVAAVKGVWQNADVDPALPFWPLLPTGWNDLPRSFQRSAVTYGRTPDKFRQVCADAREFCLRKGLKRVVVAPLNEWQEGSYIEPNEEYGFAMYDALRDVFGVKPPEGWPVNETPESVGRPNPQFPPMFHSPVQSWTFDRTPEGWYRQPYGCPVTLCKNGCLWFLISVDWNYQIRQRLVPFPAAKYSRFRLRMKVTPNARRGLGKVRREDVGMWLKWGTTETPIIRHDQTYDDLNAVSRPIEPDGQFHEYTLDLTANSGWTGDVNELWLRAANIWHAVVEIDWMRFE